LIASLALFGSYYYWDRYMHLGDKSPLELDIEYMEQVIRENPQDPEARVALAEFYLNKGLHKDALDQAEQVLGLYPENEGALLIAGVAHVHLNQPLKALDPLERFAALRKDRPMARNDASLEAAYYFWGESLVKLERPAEAIPVLEAALLINRTDADALYQLGQVYQASGQPEAALERYHQAVRFVPDFVEAYGGMIESYSTLGYSDHVVYAQGMQALSLQDYETAQTHLEIAVQALPDFAPVFLGLGLTYERLGDLEAALAAMQRALELNPDDFAAQQALGRIQALIDSQG
jgi:tetratricopeptide (TPR) repeat protein